MTVAKPKNSSSVCEHKIELVVDGQPIKQKQYKMNLNYALKV